MGHERNHDILLDIAVIANRLKSISGGNVLDVATGDGDFIHVMMDTLQDFTSFIGIDSSQHQLTKAKPRFKSHHTVKLREMNASALEFNDETFDTVCIANSLHHLHNAEKVLTEMKRVLKRGGHFILQEMFSNGNQTAAQQTDIIQHSWGAQIDSLLGETHHPTFTQQKITKLITQVQLEDVEMYISPFYLKCLLCPELEKCLDPKSTHSREQALQEIDRDLDRIKTHSRFHQLREEAEQIKARIDAFGVAPASIIFAICRKSA